MSENITSRTTRKVYIPPGNRGPRTSKKPPSDPSTTTAVFERLKLELSLSPSIPNVVVRRVIFAVDRQRFYRAQKYLPDLGYVVLDDHLNWVGTEKTEALSLAAVMPALEPQFGASNTHPGSVQVDCPLCGLRTKAWEYEEEAREWYWEKHIHESVAHR